MASRGLKSELDRAYRAGERGESISVDAARFDRAELAEVEQRFMDGRADSGETASFGSISFVGVARSRDGRNRPHGRRPPRDGVIRLSSRFVSIPIVRGVAQEPEGDR